MCIYIYIYRLGLSLFASLVSPVFVPCCDGGVGGYFVFYVFGVFV